MYLSVITPVYNRKHCIGDSIRSSLQFINEARNSFVGESFREGEAFGEVVVVDDASSDGSMDLVEDIFADEIAIGKIRLLRLDNNVGVSAAKQQGASLAEGEWLVFMDSDDSFVADCGATVWSGLCSLPDTAPLAFYRCVLQSTGDLIGEEKQALGTDAYLLPYKILLREGTPGECLPIVRREVLLRFPYEADLRGFEHLTYFKISRVLGAATVFPVVARRYCDEEEGNRLCSKQALRARGCLLSRGYIRLLLTFYRDLGLSASFSVVLRIFYHGVNCLLSARSLLTSDEGRH